jgi:hypothetical protein
MPEPPSNPTTDALPEPPDNQEFKSTDVGPRPMIDRPAGSTDRARPRRQA